MDDAVPLVDGAALRACGRDVPARFLVDVALAARTVRLACTDVLRVLPGRRVVTTSELDGHRVLVKLFVGRDAGIAAGRETDGAARLAAAGVRTPALLTTGTFAGGCAAIYEFIENGRPLALADLPAAAPVLAQLHAAALTHADLKADNFLVLADEREVHCLDAGAVRARGRSPRTRERGRDIAVLAAQFGLAGRGQLGALRAAYVRAAPNALGASADATLARAFDAALAARVRAYTAKSLRDCTEFRVVRGAGRFVACRRDRFDLLAPLLADPDAAMADGTPLKHGNSATVVRVNVAGRDVVVKRYNVPALGRRLRAVLRLRRAVRAWQSAHALRLAGIPTAAPLAVVTERAGALRGPAWLVTEFVEGERLDRVDPTPRIDAIVATLRALTDAGFVHGDAKASNFLVGREGLVLLDLDALTAPRSRAARERGRHRDAARMLANWPECDALAAALRAAALL
jgi:tRNA A-37 threonylcarbamoyl transferase component Bud32